MNFKEIKELIKIIDESGLSELSIEQDDLKLTLKKEKSSTMTGSKEVDEMVLRERISMLSAMQPSGYGGMSPVSLPAAVELGSKEIVIAQPVERAEDSHQVKSPIVGVFYSSPTPEAAAFVSVGDKVTKGQVLCIVEAMKMMNEITSDIDGEILEVLVQNQGIVEYGQLLFKIRKV